MIRVVVADDSAVVREHLRLLLASDPTLRVVGVAADGETAVELTERLRPDVLVMDVHMPRLDGHEATRRIMTRTPVPIVLVSADPRNTASDRVFEALRAGALAVVATPRVGNTEEEAGLRRVVRLMSEVKVVRRWTTGERAATSTPVAREPFAARREPVALVAIGASTGGPPVLCEVLSALREYASCPILVVQHIAPEFTAGLADWLGRASGLQVRVASPGEQARAGVVHVAPPGRQFGISGDGRLQVANGAAVDGFAPSATHLLRSAARAYGPAVVGIVLTGMGRDGGAGLLELRNSGGVTIAQDEATSVVFGMPGEAVRLNAAQHVLPPRRIALLLRRLLAQERR